MPAAMVNSALEALHDQSLPLIGLLQRSFPGSYAFMINISIFFDPRYVFLIYAPILFALNKRVGHRMIVALTCCEWANQVLKWLLAGERPYWYVYERTELLGEELKLRQFPVTCELGAGSPSGHAMVTATVWYVLIDAYLKGELKLFDKNGSNSISQSNGQPLQQEQNQYLSRGFVEALERLSWAAYMTALILVSLSRVYLACHFPHQCLCGAILGCVLAKIIVDRLPMDHLRPWHFCVATFAMFTTAMGTYAILRARGFDPLWSVGKATRWCEKPEHIHLDTTPFYSMTRYLGFCLGAGLAYDARKSASKASVPVQSPLATSGQLARRLLLLIRRAVVVGLSIGFGQLLLAIPLSRSNINLYYAISFLLYTMFSYSLATLVPDFVKSVLPTSVNFYVQSSVTTANGIGGTQTTRKKKISIKKT